jgi:hypothetical protein
VAELIQTVAALQAEPMWAASSGARELFHSDMLQWLAEHEPTAFAAVFGIDAAGKYRCERERGHLDLWIEAQPGGRSIVVENKLFSLPRDAQLDGYTEKIALRPTMAGCEQVLLSLTPPDWPEGRYGAWSWMSYQVLGKRLVDTFSGRSDFAGQFALHWGQLCLLLDELVAAVSVTGADESYELDGVREGHLDTRLAAFAHTLRAYQVGGMIRAGLDGNPVDLRVDFTRSKALIEAFCRVGTGIELGWQLQERQWRLAIRVTEGCEHDNKPCWGRGAEVAEERVRLVTDEYPEHFRFDELEQAGIEAAVAKTQRPFQHFAPDFTYQYRKVPAATVGAIVAAGVATSKRILRECRAD